MLGNIGPTELIIILVIVLIIFGAGKLPDIGTAIGKGIRNFKKATKDEDKAALEEGKDKGKS
jgi:sec-independent protein translocase protein TatA